MNEFKQIRYWVDSLPKVGRNTFSLTEVMEMFPQKPPPQVKNALNRLVASGKIASVWRGFYVVMSPEYGLSGIVPPTEYIDHLMNHLGADYYVATVSAAALHGASHHKPQAFTFACNKILHSKEKNAVRLEPLLKKHIPHKYIERRNVNSGAINVSIPILTAVDLILYPLKSGGLDNVATLLAELSDSIDINCIDNYFFSAIPISVVQRLGYLLDVILGESTLAGELYEKTGACSLKFRKAPLATYRDSNDVSISYNKKWKVIANEDVEVDV